MSKMNVVKVPHECSVGMIFNEFVKESSWLSTKAYFDQRVKEFNLTGKMRYYPGRLIRFNFCPECGKKLTNKEINHE